MAQNPVTGAPVRLVVTDEDGTFLDLGGEDFSRERFSAVFARMRADGCRFAVATSNQSFQVKDVLGRSRPAWRWRPRTGPTWRPRAGACA